jgi:hypothetical protein
VCDEPRCALQVGAQPEPREDHTACILSKYLIISGGTTQGGTKRLGDVQVLDLYSPRWEVLDDGSYTSSLPWLKSRASYTCFYGNKLFTIKPSMHEKLYELQACVLVMGAGHGKFVETAWEMWHKS